MEKIRLQERKFLRAAAEIKRKKGSFLFHNNNFLYNKSQVERIDRHMVSIAQKFFNNLPLVDNPLTNNLLLEDPSYHLSDLNHYKSPLQLKSLFDINSDKLFNGNGELIFYHRRARPNLNGDLVYALGQNI